MDVYEPAYVTNFSGAVNCLSAVSWSPHNKLCAISSEALRVLGCPCAPSEGGNPLQFDKACIEKLKEPFDLSAVPHDVLLQSLDIDSRHALMMDVTLSPDSANASLLHKTYHRALWSPLHLGGKRRCLLATLTRDHRIQVWNERSQTHWVCLAEPSQLHLDWATERWSEAPPAPESHSANTSSTARALDLLAECRKRSYSVAALEITWSHLIEEEGSEPYALLLEVTRGGVLLVWKVPSLTDSPSLQVELLKEEQTNIMRAARLCWQKTSSTSGLLVAGSDDGSVTLRTLVLGGEDKKVVQLGEALCVWQSDGIPAQHVVCKRDGEGDKYLVCVAKSRFLLCFQVAADVGRGEVQLLQSSFTRDACESPVTALDVCPSGKHSLHLVVCTMKGDMVNVYVDSDLNFSAAKLHIELPWMLQPVGLAFSPRAVYLVVFYHVITIVYENRVREPLQLMIYNWMGIDEVCNILLEGARRGGPREQLADAPDCLDRVHAYACSKGALPEALTEYVREALAPDMLEQLPSFGLQLICFLKRITTFLGKSTELEEAASRARAELLRRHISAVAKSCDPTRLSDRQKMSLRQFHRWLTSPGTPADKSTAQVFASGPLADVVVVATEAEGVERCPICEDAVFLRELSHGVCGQSHRFGRCMNSLLVCDSVPPRRCTTCDTFAHRTPIWPGDTCCLYCGKGLT
ncbi:uncharacterized protein LOC144169215 [Haemaphysalis longicornis]